MVAVPLWGYPFAPMAAAALVGSKRARRHRAMLRHLGAAAVAAATPRPALLAAALAAGCDDGDEGTGALAAGPALSSRTAFRLDCEAFWAALPSKHT